MPHPHPLKRKSIPHTVKRKALSNGEKKPQGALKRGRHGLGTRLCVGRVFTLKVNIKKKLASRLPAELGILRIVIHEL